MTAPHDLSPQTGPRTGIFMLKVVGVLVLVGMFCAGVLSFVPGGLGGIFGGDDPPEVEGNVVWDSEDLAIQLGPNGWLTHPGDGGDYVARNVRTGESWTIGDLASQMSISQDGVVVQPDEAKVLVQRRGRRARGRRRRSPTSSATTTCGAGRTSRSSRWASSRSSS